jgi:hypothetical protein
MKFAALARVPGALRFVEDHDVVGGRATVAQRLVAKVVHVLDEGLHGLAGIALVIFAARLAARDVVARQRFAQHGDQRAVARQEHGVGAGLSRCWVARFRPTSVLPAPGHAGDEADDLAALRAACSTSASTRCAVRRRFVASAS